MKLLERNLGNQHLDLLLQQFFTGDHVPESLVGIVRNFQKAYIAQGVEDRINFKESLIERCEIQIGTLHLDLTASDEEKIRKYLKANEQAEKGIDAGNEQASGQIDWQFTGVNQFGSITIRVKERSWQVEFSRLQRRISALITDETALKPIAHQVLYEKMKKTLQPLASSEPSRMLVLQGAPGLGKSHCTEHYFYHEANKHHQMVAWLSGESEEAFLRDWEALANQLRSIDSKRKKDPDTALIWHWYEEQLGQWLFIIDDVQVEMDWLKAYLPQKGGHVLITTSQPLHNLSQSAKILSFSPLLVSKEADINVLNASHKTTPRDYIKPEQKEFLAPFSLFASEMSVEECEFGFEKLSL